MSSNDEYGGSVLDSAEMRRAAGQSWLFNIVIDVDAGTGNQFEIDHSLRKLKNVGFCKIVKLHKSNDALLQTFCDNYNVFYHSAYL